MSFSNLFTNAVVVGRSLNLRAGRVGMAVELIGRLQNIFIIADFSDSGDGLEPILPPPPFKWCRLICLKLSAGNPATSARIVRSNQSPGVSSLMR